MLNLTYDSNYQFLIFQNMTTQQNQKSKNLSFYFGITCLIVVLLLVFLKDQFNTQQYLLFRILISLASACLASILSGFLNIKYKNLLSAGGGLAVFVLILYISGNSTTDTPKELNISITNSDGEKVLGIKDIKIDINDTPTKIKIDDEGIIYIPFITDKKIDFLIKSKGWVFSDNNSKSLSIVNISKQLRGNNFAIKVKEVWDIDTIYSFSNSSNVWKECDLKESFITKFLWTVKEGKYRCFSKFSKGWTIWNKASYEPLNDFDLSFDFTFIKSDHLLYAGLGFGIINDNDGFLLICNNQRYRIFQLVKGSSIEIVPWSQLNFVKGNNVKINVKINKEKELFIDHKKEAILSNYNGGKVGFLVGTDVPNEGTIDFDNFKLKANYL